MSTSHAEMTTQKVFTLLKRMGPLSMMQLGAPVLEMLGVQPPVGKWQRTPERLALLLVKEIFQAEDGREVQTWVEDWMYYAGKTAPGVVADPRRAVSHLCKVAMCRVYLREFSDLPGSPQEELPEEPSPISDLFPSQVWRMEEESEEGMKGDSEKDPVS